MHFADGYHADYYYSFKIFIQVLEENYESIPILFKSICRIFIIIKEMFTVKIKN